MRLAAAVVAVAALGAGGGCFPKKDRTQDVFTSKEGKFRAMFPGEPKSNSFGGPYGVNMTMFSADWPDSSYMVGYFDVPEWAFNQLGGGGKMLENGRDGALAAVKAKLDSTNDVLVAGYPGVGFTAKLSEGPSGRLTSGYLRGRVVMAKSRVYMIMCVGEKPSVGTAEANRFMESLVITQ